MLADDLREAEQFLRHEEAVFAARMRRENRLHRERLADGADELDERVRHEEVITRLHAPVAAASAAYKNLENAYRRVYALDE